MCRFLDFHICMEEGGVFEKTAQLFACLVAWNRSVRKAKPVPSLQLQGQESHRIKFSSCIHLQNDFKLLATKRPQIWTIYEAIAWLLKTGRGWCVGSWQNYILILFRKENNFFYPFISMLLLLVVSKMREIRDTPKSATLTVALQACVQPIACTDLKYFFTQKQKCLF